MNFVSIRIITHDVQRLTTFYEAIAGNSARHYTPDFAELATGACRLAIADAGTLKPFGAAVALEGASRAVIVEFRADDVDATYARLETLIGDALVQAPTTMPWGNRSLLFRDPDGNLVNVFAPVTPDAIARFGG